MQAEFIQPSDPRWTAFLARCPHDFYHLPEYTSFSSRYDAGEPVAFLAEHDGGSLLVPLLLRPVPENLNGSAPLWDAVSPYGFASPVCNDGGSRALAIRLWECFVEACRARAIIAIFLRFNPLLPIVTGCDAVGKMILAGETVCIDVSQSEEQMLRDMRDNHKKDIRKLSNSGFRAVIDDWALLDSFIDTYLETMTRVGASGYYHFDRSYYYDLKDLTAGNVHLCAVLSPTAETAAAGLLFSHDGLMHFHLSATAAAYAKFAPNKLMFDAARRWGKENGCRSLHLGGGVGCSRDSLFHFKAGFSKNFKEYYVCSIVADQDHYNSCARTWLASQAFAPPLDDNFFPIYRRLPFCEATSVEYCNPPDDGRPKDGPLPLPKCQRNQSINQLC